MGYDGIIDMAERDGYIIVTPLGYHPRAWYGSRGPGIPPGAAAQDDKEPLPANLGELSEQDVMNVLEIARGEFNVDRDRIYLWGHSMGGAGTYHLAAQHPDIWAGLAVAAPAPQQELTPDRLSAFRRLPILVLHGDSDKTVPVEGTRRWVAKMAELGMQHVYIEVEGGDHTNFIAKDRAMLSIVFSFFDIARKHQRPAGVPFPAAQEAPIDETSLKREVNAFMDEYWRLWSAETCRLHPASAPFRRVRMMSSAWAMMRSTSSRTVGTSWMSPATMPQDQTPASIWPSCMIRG